MSLLREEMKKEYSMEVTHTSYTTAPESTTTVAPFRAWRGLRFIVAREPMQITIEYLQD